MSSLRPVGGTPRDVVAALGQWLDAEGEPEPIIIETSGSTGAPKRVVLSRRAVVASARATTDRLGVEGAWLLALPVSYVAGVQVVVRSLLAGHEPVHLDEHRSLAAAVGRGPRLASLVPTQLHRLLASQEDTEALGRLNTILLGGGPIDPALRRRADEAGVRVVATYGSSETAGGCVYDGHPLDGVRLATDEAGRIRIAGPTLFERYDGDPALTARVLRDGWFLTDDVGRVHDDGRLEVHGRIDDVVISGGVNIPTPAVARRLREHPAVQAAEVLGVPDEEWGHRVVALVVGDLDREAAREWVAAVHPRTWAPADVVRLDALPLLGNGKVDRQRLTELAR